jgi:hypothetical protein
VSKAIPEKRAKKMAAAKRAKNGCTFHFTVRRIIRITLNNSKIMLNMVYKLKIENIVSF